MTSSYTPGTAPGLDWSNLGFTYRETRSHLRVTYKDGAWQAPELVKGTTFAIHIGATALHYGQACFEGLKAFCHQDGTVNVFRPDENARRMQSSAARTVMPALETEAFVDAVSQVVADNKDYVPPYGSNGSLYIRPLLFGSGHGMGIQPADEYTLLILVLPVGDYYHGGLIAPVAASLITDYDRAAPRGVGNVKVAGNYAADLLPNQQQKKAGYPISLYLDAATQTKIEEFSTSNFVAIKGNTYVTPKSASVLPSITNKTLMQIAKDQGMQVEQREILLQELADFDEVFAVGTAVVLTPVGSIRAQDRIYEFGETGVVGPVTQKLYDTVRAIQKGEVEDKYGWNVAV